jgi:hypothetical protein
LIVGELLSDGGRRGVSPRRRHDEWSSVDSSPHVYVFWLVKRRKLSVDQKFREKIRQIYLNCFDDE